MAADLRERVARAIANLYSYNPDKYWPDYADQADAVLAELRQELQPQAEPVAFFPNRKPDVDASDAPAHWYHKGWNDCRTQALHARAPQPQPALLTNPHTGTPRDYRDVESDPAGVLIQEPGAPLRAAAPQPQAEDAHTQAWWDGYHSAMRLFDAPAPQPQPQPQASAEDVALVDGVIQRHVEWHAPIGVAQAWQRIRASLGVGK